MDNKELNNKELNQLFSKNRRLLEELRLRTRLSLSLPRDGDVKAETAKGGEERPFYNR